MNDSTFFYTLREEISSDNEAIHQIVLSAFGNAEGEEIVQLLIQLQQDETAHPLLSLVATENDQILGHILFTVAQIVPMTASIRAMLLAPLAVHPAWQNRGIGGMLIKTGLTLLSQQGVDVVFVLGHPNYYQKHGFMPAEENGFTAPHPILPENAGAWMVQPLRTGLIGQVRGEVQCAEAISDPKYWQE